MFNKLKVLKTIFIIFVLLIICVGYLDPLGGMLQEDLHPRKDKYGQYCKKPKLSADWQCLADSEEFKKLKAENCKYSGMIQTTSSLQDYQYRYTCNNGKLYVLNTNYYGLR